MPCICSHLLELGVDLQYIQAFPGKQAQDYRNIYPPYKEIPGAPVPAGNPVGSGISPGIGEEAAHVHVAAGEDNGKDSVIEPSAQARRYGRVRSIVHKGALISSDHSGQSCSIFG